MAQKKLKPFRVSYYFADSAVDGKARLWTRYVKAFTAEEAKAQVVSVFAGAPGQLVVVNAYKHYKTPVRPKKAFFVDVPAPVVPPTPPAPIVRPAGNCKFHDVPLEADGRCPAIDPGYVKPLSRGGFTVGPISGDSALSAGDATSTSVPPAGFVLLGQTQDARVDGVSIGDADVYVKPLDTEIAPVENGPEKDINAVLTETSFNGCGDSDCIFCHPASENLAQEPDLAQIDNTGVPEPDFKNENLLEVTFTVSECDNPSCEICADPSATNEDQVTRSLEDQYRDDVASQDLGSQNKRPVPKLTLVVLFSGAALVGSAIYLGGPKLWHFLFPIR
jgi:hypothetical protein